MIENQEIATDWLNDDFVPALISAASVHPEERMARAAEYTAYHVGQISRNLNRITLLLDEVATALALLS